jgi:geranylgeranyl pyrophosphate synthase
MSLTPPSFVADFQARTESALRRWLPDATTEPTGLHEAMRYATLGGGKRIRPVLVFAAGACVGATKSALDAPAVAVEFIHAYSLVHDDLPAMDDDDLRRGRPTCHKAFDEATAILAGDALQALAFDVLAKDEQIVVDASQRIRMIGELTSASGSLGMAGGQAIDLAAVGQQLSVAELENMHLHKTGALIRSSVKLGALSLPGVEDATLERLDNYAKCVGLAFQVRDDILDVEGDTAVIGKPQGSDIERNKPTYPNLLGMHGAKKAAHDLHQEALASLESFSDAAEPLHWLADYIVNREK